VRLVHRQLERPLERLIFVPELILVDVAVLDDERRDALGPAHGQPQPNLRSEIVQVDRKAPYAELVEEPRQEVRIAVEIVAEPDRRVGIAGAREIRRQQPPAVGQCRHIVAELVGRARIAVRQQHDRRVRRPRLAIEAVDPVEVDLPVSHRGLIHSVVPGSGSLLQDNNGGGRNVLAPRRNDRAVDDEWQCLPLGVADGRVQRRKLELQPGQQVGAAGPAHHRLDEALTGAPEDQAPASGIAGTGTHGRPAAPENPRRRPRWEESAVPAWADPHIVICSGTNSVNLAPHSHILL
jgi:hypothetical protein